MRKWLCIVAGAVGVPAALFVGTALVLGKPSANEPPLLKQLRFKMRMWGEAIAVFGYGLWHPHLLFSGATAAEKRMSLPGDRLVAHANHCATYAITIDASPEDIWPWLVQMGEGRASWYAWSPVHTYSEYRHEISPFTINPAWQSLQVGQILLDGDVRGVCDENTGAWRVAEIDDGRALVFFSARDLVEGHEFDPAGPRPKGMYAVTSWAFCICEVDAGRSRLLIRVRAEAGPRLLLPIARLIFGSYDRVWERTILEGVKTRVEHGEAGSQSIPPGIRAAGLPVRLGEV